MKAIIHSVAIALPLLFGFAAYAQHQTFTVNPNASQVAFSLSGTGHHVTGTFHVQTGSVDFDRKAQTISGSVVVSAASGDSGDKSRDKNMHNNVLDVEHYADVSFVPKSYQGTISPNGDSTIQVSGVFTLHGTPHDLTVLMQIHIDNGALTAKTQFTVPYVKWGLKDPSVFILKVSKDVDVNLTLTGQVTPAS
jgi:polyisoprenoid-binding protein YceI